MVCDEVLFLSSRLARVSQQLVRNNSAKASVYCFLSFFVRRARASNKSRPEKVLRHIPVEGVGKCWYSYGMCSLRIFAGAALLIGAFPLFVSAQSLEWLAEHPGQLTPAIAAATDTPIYVPTTAPTPLPVAHTNDGIENKVLQYFANEPVMYDIAKCESRFRQYDSNGNALDGGSGGMIGIFQIAASIHAAYAKSLGMDIYTVDGNMAYAKKLYTEEGTGPWLDSFPCWHPITQAGHTDPLTQNLVLGTISPEVKALQILLNTHGYVLTTSGPGSPGQETDKFGSLTRAAIKKFQCEKLQICSGNEATTGYGIVNPATRTALLALAGNSTVPSTDTASNPSSAQADQIAALQKQITELSAQLYTLKQKFAMQ